MSKYRVLAGFCIRHGEDVHPGDVVTFDNEMLARIEVANHRVKLIVEDVPVEAKVAPPDGATVVEKGTRRR